MKNTLIVNLFGAPGSGKSTAMAGLFYLLKSNGIEAEMATEFAKELIWEKRYGTMKDEIYIFAKQQHRLFTINGQVDVIVTDRPLPLTCCYDHLYGTDSKELHDLCLATFHKYNNINFFLERTKTYNKNGRNQTEEESDKIAEIIKDYVLIQNHIPYETIPADENIDQILFEKIMNQIRE